MLLLLEMVLLKKIVIELKTVEYMQIHLYTQRMKKVIIILSIIIHIPMEMPENMIMLR